MGRFRGSMQHLTGTAAQLFRPSVFRIGDGDFVGVYMLRRRCARLGGATQKGEAKVRLGTPEPPLFGTMVRLRWVISGRSTHRSSSDACAGTRSSFGSLVLRYIDPIATGHFGTMLYDSILGRGLPCPANAIRNFQEYAVSLLLDAKGDESLSVGEYLRPRRNDEQSRAQRLQSTCIARREPRFQSLFSVNANRHQDCSARRPQ